MIYCYYIDVSGAGEALSRRKSFKKTLRESFRRLRRGRSTRNNPTSTAVPTPAPTTTTNPTTIETRPIERQVEARAIDDGMGSMVRCLTFAQTYLINNSNYILFEYILYINNIIINKYLINLSIK